MQNESLIISRFFLFTTGISDTNKGDTLAIGYVTQK